CDVTVGPDFNFSGKEPLPAADRLCGHFLEVHLSVVITHMTRMVLRHPESHSTLEPPGIAARHGISFVPSKGLRSFFQDLDGGERVVMNDTVLSLYLFPKFLIQILQQRLTSPGA